MGSECPPGWVRGGSAFTNLTHFWLAVTVECQIEREEVANLFPRHLEGFSNIEIANIQCVILNKLAARLNFISHKPGEHLFGLNRICEIDAKKFPFRGIHGRIEQLARIHFTETFEALDRETSLAHLFDSAENFWN